MKKYLKNCKKCEVKIVTVWNLDIDVTDGTFTNHVGENMYCLIAQPEVAGQRTKALAVSGPISIKINIASGSSLGIIKLIISVY